MISSACLEKFFKVTLAVRTSSGAILLIYHHIQSSRSTPEPQHTSKVVSRAFSKPVFPFGSASSAELYRLELCWRWSAMCSCDILRDLSAIGSYLAPGRPTVQSECAQNWVIGNVVERTWFGNYLSQGLVIEGGLTSLSFDDAGRGCDSRLGGRGHLAGAHAEEGEDRLTDAIRQQDARGQRRKHRTHQDHRITHRNIPQLSPAPLMRCQGLEARPDQIYCYKD